MQCSPGYEGTPTTIKCNSPGELYNFSGCTKIPVCKSTMEQARDHKGAGKWFYKQWTQTKCPNGQRVQSLKECAEASGGLGITHYPTYDRPEYSSHPLGCFFIPQTHTLYYRSSYYRGGRCSPTSTCLCRDSPRVAWPERVGYDFHHAVEHHLRVDIFNVSNPITMCNR